MGYADWLKPDPDRMAEAQEAVSWAAAQVWEPTTDHWYTCVPPPGYGADHAVTAAIRTFDPGAIPIWRIQMWHAPGRRLPVQVVHVGIARYLPIPTHERHRHLQVQMPQDADHEIPNFLDTFFEGEQVGPGGPMAYVPWNWDAHATARSEFDRLKVEEFDRLIEARKAREAKIRADWQEEMEYRRRDVEPRILRILDEKVGEYDWKQLDELYRHGPRKAKGRKPFVHVRGVAPTGQPS